MLWFACKNIAFKIYVQLENIGVAKFDGGIDIIEKSLCSGKALTVLDDLCHGDLLEREQQLVWLEQGIILLVLSQFRYMLFFHITQSP